jgi:protein TonB
LSLAFHLALYTLADWAGLRAAAPPPPRSVIEALLILPEIAPAPPAEPRSEEAPPPVEAPVAVPPAPATEPPRPPAPLPAAVPAAPRAELKPAAARPSLQFYPREAVLRGLEGEVLVSVTLDARGRVVAARLERGSGHAILDEAALVAARTLKSLPPGEREATLPVRFKLN